jgi:DHHC palmitoyltransferase
MMTIVESATFENYGTTRDHHHLPSSSSSTTATISTMTNENNHNTNNVRTEDPTTPSDHAVILESSLGGAAPQSLSSPILVSPERQQQQQVVPVVGSSWDDIAANDDNDMVRHWRSSPFAVGLTKATWADEEIGCCALMRNFNYVTLSACICSRLGAGRVGNMVVLFQRMEDYHDQSTGRTVRRPRLLWVIGPYWMVLLCLTLPLFTLLSFWTAYTRVLDQSLPVIITWAICTSVLFLSLCMVSCKDPGTLYRHNEPPTGQEENWLWNDQALTYRPASAKYDVECAAVIEGFDHTCPWTGTAIGKKNMFWFRVFCVFVLVAIVYNAALLTLI